MSALKYIITAVVAGGAGFAAAYFMQKKRYEKEISDFKAEYRAKNKKMEDAAKATAARNEELKNKVKETMDMKRYEETLKKANYDTRSSHFGSEDRWEKKEETPQEPRRKLKEGEPYVIDEFEYDDEDYRSYDKTVEFSLYDDDTVADEMGEKMDEADILNTIGWEFRRWFKEHPDEDACYVRNNKYRTDYCVARVMGNYPEEEGEE